MRDQRIDTDLSALLQHDYRLDGLTPTLVGNTDHRGVGHARMSHESLFHLAAIYVLPATDNHVLFSVGEIDEAVLVGITHVAGVKPAVAQCRDAGNTIVPVPHHILWRTQADLPNAARHDLLLMLVNDSHTRRHHRLPDGGQPFQILLRTLWPMVMLAQRHSRPFGMPTTVDEDGAAPPQRPLENRERHGGCRIVESLERGQVVFVDVRKIQDGLYEGRCKVKLCYAVALHGLDDLCR